MNTIDSNPVLHPILNVRSYPKLQLRKPLWLLLKKMGRKLMKLKYEVDDQTVKS